MSGYSHGKSSYLYIRQSKWWRKIELRLGRLRPIPQRARTKFQFLPKTVSTSLELPPKTLTCLDPTTLPNPIPSQS